jgi:hypothetical protein
MPVENLTLIPNKAEKMELREVPEYFANVDFREETCYATLTANRLTNRLQENNFNPSYNLAVWGLEDFPNVTKLLEPQILSHLGVMYFLII